MPLLDFNPAGAANVGPSLDHPSLRRSPLRVHTTGVLANDATFIIGDTSKAEGFWKCWDAAVPANSANFSVKSDSTVTLVIPIETGGNWAASDSATDLCFWDDSGVLTITNNQSSATIYFVRLM